MSIEARGISKSFGAHRALCDVDLKVDEGQLVALLGPSGSGKTTLLRVIAGLEEPDPGSGGVFFHGENVADKHVSARRVGFVFQHYALFRHMSVFENVAFGLRVKPRAQRPARGEIRDRVHELLKLVQLESFAARYPHQLSGGQRQRIALARALAVEPRVLLLDEPFGALDAKVRKELRSWLRRLHDTIRVTSLFVTHDQDEALEVADKVVVMNEGRVEQEGSPDEVYHHPQTEFVMHFLGEVNSFTGHVAGGTVEFGDIQMPWLKDQKHVKGAARVFVRPYDVTIDTKRTDLPSVQAEVVRLHSAGPVVRVDLLTSTGQRLTSEISQERFATMNLDVGASTWVRPRHIRVFAE